MTVGILLAWCTLCPRSCSILLRQLPGSRPSSLPAHRQPSLAHPIVRFGIHRQPNASTWWSRPRNGRISRQCRSRCPRGARPCCTAAARRPCTLCWPEHSPMTVGILLAWCTLCPRSCSILLRQLPGPRPSSLPAHRRPSLAHPIVRFGIHRQPNTSERAHPTPRCC